MLETLACLKRVQIAVPEILLKNVSRQHLSFKRGHNKVPVLVDETTGHQRQLKTAQHLAAQFVQHVYIVQNVYIVHNVHIVQNAYIG